MTVPKVHTGGSLSVFPNQVALATIGRKMRVLLATSDGYLYIYDLPGGRKAPYLNDSFFASPALL